MKNHLLVSILATILCYSCTPEERDCDTLYFSSFENIAELSEFKGNGYYRKAHAPANAGDSCLVVCGGCIGPHLYFDLGPFPETMEVSMNFMGKTDHGGTIMISATSDSQAQQTINVLDTTWTYYATEENILLQANDTLRIDFNSGGFAAVTTYFDLLTISCEE